MNVSEEIRRNVKTWVEVHGEMSLKEVVQKLRRMSTYRRLWNLTVSALCVRSSSVIVVKTKKGWIVRKRA